MAITSFFEQVVETTPQTGFATFKAISNKKSVEIQILGKELKTISLKQQDIKKYKFVYISRDGWKRQNYTVEYSINGKNSCNNLNN
jgi:adenylosuccinate synthase